MLPLHMLCINTTPRYISALLLSLNTMLHLELPHINVLSKIDLVRQYGKLGEVHVRMHVRVQSPIKQGLWTRSTDGGAVDTVTGCSEWSGSQRGNRPQMSPVAGHTSACTCCWVHALQGPTTVARSLARAPS